MSKIHSRSTVVAEVLKLDLGFLLEGTWEILSVSSIKTPFLSSQSLVICNTPLIVKSQEISDHGAQQFG